MVQSFLQATAWAMKPPAPYGPFHLIFTFFGVSTSILLARRLASKETQANRLTAVFMRPDTGADRNIQTAFYLLYRK